MVLDTGNQNIAQYRRLNSEATRISSFGDISTVSGSKILDPLQQLLANDELARISLNEMTEAIIHWVQVNHGIDEFVSAQKEFQTLTGRVFHDDSFYHQRMSYFLDYFTFQRPIQGSLRENDEGSTPYLSFMNSGYLSKKGASQEVLDRFEDLADYRHSLFQIVRNTKNRIIVRDLYSKEKHEISGDNNLIFHGFASGSILQGFIFKLAGAACLSQGVLLHPPVVARLVRRAVKQSKSTAVPGDDHMSVLTKLAKQHLSVVRHRHLEARRLYSQEPR